MSRENLELAKQAIAAANDAYAKDDIAPWRQEAETIFDPEVVLEAGDAFTEGEWHGKEGAVGFVANQMEVLKEMWMRLDEFIAHRRGVTFHSLRRTSEPCRRGWH